MDTNKQIPLEAINELVSASHASTPNVLTDAHTLLRTIHCSKTGQPIGTRTEMEITNFLKLHGSDTLQTVYSLIDLATQPSLAWLYTDNAHLDKLQDIDPRGFFCFCIQTCLMNHHLQYTSKSKKGFRYGIEGQRAFRNSLVQAWYNTERIPLSDLMEINKELRYFLYLGFHQSAYYRLPWHNVRQDDSYQIYYTEVASVYATENPNTVAEREAKGLSAKTATVDKLKIDGVDTDDKARLLTVAKKEVSKRKDLDTYPLLPHEMTNDAAIEWLRNQLKHHVREISRKARLDASYYSALNTVNMFKTKGTVRTAIETLKIMIDDIELDNTMGLSQLVKMEALLTQKKKEIKGKSVVTINAGGLDKLKELAQSKAPLPNQINNPAPAANSLLALLQSQKNKLN